MFGKVLEVFEEAPALVVDLEPHGRSEHAAEYPNGFDCRVEAHTRALFIDPGYLPVVAGGGYEGRQPRSNVRQRPTCSVIRDDPLCHVGRHWNAGLADTPSNRRAGARLV